MFSGDRKRLTEAMDARYARLGLTWRQIAADGGLAYETLRSVRHGAGRRGWQRVPVPTRRAIEQGMRWPTGYVDRLLAGEDVPANPEPAGPAPGDPGKPSLQVVEGSVPELLDDTERALWAIDTLSEAERWSFIADYRGRRGGLHGRRHVR